KVGASARSESITSGMTLLSYRDVLTRFQNGPPHRPSLSEQKQQPTTIKPLSQGATRCSRKTRNTSATTGALQTDKAAGNSIIRLLRSNAGCSRYSRATENACT